MKKVLTGILLACIYLGSSGFTSDVVQVYSKADEFAQSGRADFAFMYYNQILRDYPESKYREKALFAVGEYYFRISSFQESEKIFEMFLKNYPESNERLYALAHLLNVAQKNKNREFIQALEKQIIDLQQVSFVFRESKELTYRSPLCQKYKTVIYIDKIEFYLEGKIFAKVSY